MRFFLIVLKNIARNPLRTVLTGLGTMVLVLVVTGIWTVLTVLDNAMADKGANIKGIVTERWQIPSQMPYSYAEGLSRGAPDKTKPDSVEVKPDDSMTWQFYGGTIDPKSRTRDAIIFFFAMDPKKINKMMDELDELKGERMKDLEASIQKMCEKRTGIIIGPDRLKSLQNVVGKQLRVGDTLTVTSMNYKGIDLEVQIVGILPAGTRHDSAAFLNRDYLTAAMDQYEGINGKKHPMANKSLNLVWLRAQNKEEFATVAQQILTAPEFSSPSVKFETASSGISTFLESYQNLIWGMRWILTPAAMFTLTLVVANAISISVRERRLEFAVLKVLGFQPNHVLLMILGEALLVGTLFAVLSAGGTWYLINKVVGGLAIPIGFFPKFMVSPFAMTVGIATGIFAAFLGAIFPAWSARSTRVAEVFSRVA